MKPICLVLVLSLTGCSFFMTRGPSDNNRPPRAYPDCTTSMTYPIVDGVLSGLFLTAMIGAINEDDQSSTSFDDDEASKAEKITSSALLAAVAGASAYVGYRRVSRCRASHESFAAAYPNGMMPYGAVPYGYQQPAYYPPTAGAAPTPYPGQAPQPMPQGVPQASPHGVPQPYPGQAPAAAPAPVAPAQMPPATPAAAPVAPAAALGTEGDVCTSNAECATGLACASNVCMRPAAPRKQ